MRAAPSRAPAGTSTVAGVGARARTRAAASRCARVADPRAVMKELRLAAPLATQDRAERPGGTPAAGIRVAIAAGPVPRPPASGVVVWAVVGGVDPNTSSPLIKAHKRPLRRGAPPIKALIASLVCGLAGRPLRPARRRLKAVIAGQPVIAKVRLREVARAAVGVILPAEGPSNVTARAKPAPLAPTPQLDEVADPAAPALTALRIALRIIRRARRLRQVARVAQLPPLRRPGPGPASCGRVPLRRRALSPRTIRTLLPAVARRPRVAGAPPTPTHEEATRARCLGASRSRHAAARKGPVPPRKVKGRTRPARVVYAHARRTYS